MMRKVNVIRQHVDDLQHAARLSKRNPRELLLIQGDFQNWIPLPAIETGTAMGRLEMITAHF
jgi:hypothetical protein